MKNRGLFMKTPQKLYDEAFKLASTDNSEESKSRAAVLLLESSRHGCAEASFALANWYGIGIFFKKNRKNEIKFLKISAKQGCVEAIFHLAIRYEKGVGSILKKNESKAVELYLNSAMLGYDDSFYELYRCFYYGIGVNMNIGVAKIWKGIADKKGVKFR